MRLDRTVEVVAVLIQISMRVWRVWRGWCEERNGATQLIGGRAVIGRGEGL